LIFLDFLILVNKHMSKIFAGELVGEELAFGLGLAPETAGLSIPLTFMSIGVTTLIHASRKAHE